MSTNNSKKNNQLQLVNDLDKMLRKRSEEIKNGTVKMYTWQETKDAAKARLKGKQ